MRPPSRGSSGPAPSSSARPISISSRPAWSGVRSPYGVAAQSVRCRASSRAARAAARRRGRGRPRAARARHRHGGLRPRSGRAQQHRRAQAEPWSRLHRRGGAGLPDARLRLGVRAHRRRRISALAVHGRPRSGRSLFARAAARRACGAVPRGIRLGVPMPGQRLFFGDRRSAAAYEAALGATSPGSALPSSRSTSSRSMRRRGCCTKGPGWPSAISRRAR